MTYNNNKTHRLQFRALLDADAEEGYLRAWKPSDAPPGGSADSGLCERNISLPYTQVGRSEE